MAGKMRVVRWCAAVVVLGSAAPAPAFYWKNWPGTPGAKIDQSVMPPGLASPGTPVANPAFPGGDLEYPTVPPQPPGPPPPPPENVPEPGTAVAGLVGLGVLAARKWRKRS